MIVGVDEHPLGATDAGDARESRKAACTKTAWCRRRANHKGPCVADPPAQYQRQSWDTKTADPSGWAERRRSRYP